jgi:hypothetical protein
MRRFDALRALRIGDAEPVLDRLDEFEAGTRGLGDQLQQKDPEVPLWTRSSMASSGPTAPRPLAPEFAGLLMVIVVAQTRFVMMMQCRLILMVGGSL